MVSAGAPPNWRGNRGTQYQMNTRTLLQVWRLNRDSCMLAYPTLPR